MNGFKRRTFNTTKPRMHPVMTETKLENSQTCYQENHRSTGSTNLYRDVMRVALLMLSSKLTRSTVNKNSPCMLQAAIGSVKWSSG